MPGSLQSVSGPTALHQAPHGYQDFCSPRSRLSFCTRCFVSGILAQLRTSSPRCKSTFVNKSVPQSMRRQVTQEPCVIVKFNTAGLVNSILLLVMQLTNSACHVEVPKEGPFIAVSMHVARIKAPTERWTHATQKPLRSSKARSQKPLKAPKSP